MRRALAFATGTSIAMIACYPTTTRPPFPVQQMAPNREILLPIDRATTATALAFDTDSIPVQRTEVNDGWIETPWFDAATLQPTSRRPLGPDVVKIRAFIDPGRLHYSVVSIEAVFRPFADPSEESRALEREVPHDHPVAKRVDSVLAQLSRQYHGIEPDTARPKKSLLDSAAGLVGPGLRRKLLGDSTARPVPDTLKVRSDSTQRPVAMPTDTTALHKPAQR